MRAVISVMLLLPSILWAQDLFNENLTPAQARATIAAGADVNARGESGGSPLHVAAEHNENPEMLQVLIDAGADLEAGNNQWKRPLMLAAEHNGNPEVLQVLIDAGADIEAWVKDYYAWQAIHFSVDGYNVGALKTLIDAGADVNEPTQRNGVMFPIQQAAKKWYDATEVMAILLAAGANPDQRGTRSIPPWDASNMVTPLLYAAREGSFENVRFLLEAGADPSYSYTEAKDDGECGPHGCRTVFDFVSGRFPEQMANDPDLSNLLVEGHRQATERLAFFDLVQEGSPSAVKAAITAGADVSARDRSDRTPLMVAAEYTENAEVIQALIDADADVMAQDMRGQTALMIAVRETENTEVIQALLDAGSDVMARAYGWDWRAHTAAPGATPLMAAAGNHNSGVTQILINSGAGENIPPYSRLEAIDSGGNTALHHAALNENPEVIKMLIELGGNLEARNNHERTPLMRAAAHNEGTENFEDGVFRASDQTREIDNSREFTEEVMIPATLLALLEAGANPEARDGEGRTGLMLAAFWNINPNVLQVLLDAGVDMDASDNHGQTALHHAGLNPETYKGPRPTWQTMTNLLLAAGANTSVTDRDGKTAQERFGEYEGQR